MRFAHVATRALAFSNIAILVISRWACVCKSAHTSQYTSVCACVMSSSNIATLAHVGAPVCMSWRARHDTRRSSPECMCVAECRNIRPHVGGAYMCVRRIVRCNASPDTTKILRRRMSQHTHPRRCVCVHALQRPVRISYVSTSPNVVTFPPRRSVSMYASACMSQRLPYVCAPVCNADLHVAIFVQMIVCLRTWVARMPQRCPYVGDSTSPRNR